MPRISYHLVAGDDNEKTAQHLKSLRNIFKISLQGIALAFFISMSLVLSILLLQYQSTSTDAAFNFPALDITSHKKLQQYEWWSEFSDPLRLEAVEERWSNIIPAHGIVAVDYKWAQNKRLPESLKHPENPDQRVYIIDAYHQMHCLTIIRRTFYQISTGQPLTFPMGHSRHCFDSLRQYIQCTAGDTLLYSWGLNTTGDGQTRQCRDWGALKTWASEHSACYQDYDRPTPLLEHFGHCDNGDDGLGL